MKCYVCAIIDTIPDPIVHRPGHNQPCDQTWAVPWWWKHSKCWHSLPTLLHPPTSLVAFSSSSSFFRIWSWSYWQALVCCTFGNAVLTISKEFCPRQLDGNGRGDPKWASKSNTDFGHLRSTCKDLFPKLWLEIYHNLCWGYLSILLLFHIGKGWTK